MERQEIIFYGINKIAVKLTLTVAYCEWAYECLGQSPLVVYYYHNKHREGHGASAHRRSALEVKNTW